MKKIKIHLNKKTKIILWSVLVVLLIALVVLFFVFGTGKKNLVDKQEEEVKTEEPETTPEPEVPKVQIIDLDSKSRNVAVMINNIRTVWGYQSGLQDAYLIYEMIVEGGYTRLMAIYKDKMPERIGSVRSARPYYLDYALENDALYIHFGGSDQALRDVRTLGIILPLLQWRTSINKSLKRVIVQLLKHLLFSIIVQLKWIYPHMVQ